MSYKGKKLEYSPEWSGPLKKRSCTDWPCLVIFAVVMTCWIGTGIYALVYGNMEVLLAPSDSHGRKCGFNSEVVNELNLVSFDLNKCLDIESGCGTTQVCRKECPSSNWDSALAWNEQPLDYVRKNIICETGIDVKNQTKEQLYSMMEENKCAKWVLDSTPFLHRCLPKSIPSEFISIRMAENDLREAQISMKGRTVLTAAISTRGTVLGLIFAGAVVCLLHIFLLRWFAFPLVLTSVVGLCSFFSYFSYYFYGRYVDDNGATWLTLTIVFAIIAGVIVLIVLCLLKKIRLACQLIEEASNAVMSILYSLLFPLFPWFLHLASVVYVVVIGLYLYTAETKETWLTVLLYVIHAVGFMWFYCFVTALGEMILAATFASWYWTFRKFDVPSFLLAVSAWRTVRYHLGTIAFGSLLITICRLVRYLLETVRYYVGRKGELFSIICSSFAIFIVKSLEKSLKFMNRNAYIISALYGKGLCSSAVDALSLIVRNAQRVIVLNNIVSWLLSLGKTFISIVMGLITWWYFTSTENAIECWWVPVIFVVIGAYLVANSFFSVYEVAVDTIFLCFLEDCERNDGSVSKPYYMSSQLRILLLHKDV